MYDLTPVFFPLPYFVLALCQDPLRARFFTLSTFANGTYCICNLLTFARLQVFCNPKKTKKGGTGVQTFLYQNLHTHSSKFFFIFLRPPKNRCQKVEKRGQKGVFLG